MFFYLFMFKGVYMKNKLALSPLKESFATVIYALIISDTVISRKERRQF